MKRDYEIIVEAPSETLLKNHRGRNAPKLILWGQNHPDIKKKKKKKIQVNIIDEHRYKNPHQNTSKPYLTIHFKDHTPWSTGIYPRDARDCNICKSTNVIYHINKL